MKAYLEGWSIVLAGYWNHNIFSPEWITEHLTDSTKIKIEFPMSKPLTHPRYRFDNIILQFTPNELVLSPEYQNNSTLLSLESVAIKILTELQHTPLSAVGINFWFVEDDPQRTLLGIFGISDTQSLSTHGFKIKSTTVERTLTDDTLIINLMLQYKEDGKISIGFNFHCLVSSTAEAKKFIETFNVKSLRQRAYEILDSVYDAPVDDEMEATC
ncbi:MAG: hypothetical protein HQK56_03810 [Deltaproteobacteria bacterium]|nr:hypothetical protein [Deltaproteobacteria bacterium]